MSYKDRIPGMTQNNRKRNIVVGGGYVLLLLFLLANSVTVIGLLILLSPVIIAIIVGKNYRGSADELTRLPGISDEGGIRAGVSAFVYTIVFVGVLMGGLAALAPSDDTSGEETEVTEGEAEATEADEMSTVTVQVVDNNDEAIENADVEFVHDDAIIFDTRENKQTDSDGIVSFETETDSNVDITAEANGYEESDTSLTVSQDEEVTLTLQEVPEESEEAGDAESDDMHTVTVHVVNADDEAIQSANVEFVHDDAIIFNTRENKQTDSDGKASFETEAGGNVDITAEASGYEEADASLTVTQDEEVTLTLQEVSEETEEAEQDTESGDTEEEENTPDTDEVADETEETEESVDSEASREFSEEEYLILMETVIEDQGLDVSDIYVEDGTTHVEYRSYAQTENELAGELGTVAGAYAGAVGEGHESEQLQITVLDATGNEAGTTTLDAGTAEGYYNGEVSGDELTIELLGNLEAND